VKNTIGSITKKGLPKNRAPYPQLKIFHKKKIHFNRFYHTLVSPGYFN